MVVITPALLTNVVAPVLGLGAQVAQMAGAKPKVVNSLKIGAMTLGMAEPATKAFGGEAKTGTTSLGGKAAKKTGTDFDPSLKIGESMDFGTGAFLDKLPGGILGKQLGIKPLTDSGLGFNTNLEGLTSGIDINKAFDWTKNSGVDWTIPSSAQ